MITRQKLPPTGALRVIQYVTWPFRKIGGEFELRRLRHQLPNVRRRLINMPNGVRTETDDEYLGRLREIYLERFGGLAVNPPAAQPGPVRPSPVRPSPVRPDPP
jgi:hypothetical protein